MDDEARTAQSDGPAGSTTGLEGPMAALLVVVCLVAMGIGIGAVARTRPAKVVLPAPGSTIKAELSEWKIATPTHLKAGTYHYVITNTGTMEHEMLVMKTDLPATRLPMKGTDIDEDKLPPLSDGENVEPGKSQTRTIDLSKPGRYLFVCNIPGHFRQGMYTFVVVS